MLPPWSKSLIIFMAALLSIKFVWRLVRRRSTTRGFKEIPGDGNKMVRQKIDRLIDAADRGLIRDYELPRHTFLSRTEGHSRPDPRSKGAEPSEELEDKGGKAGDLKKSSKSACINERHVCLIT